MEFHPGFSLSHGLCSAIEGVKYTRTYCLLKMRVASTPLLPPSHPHHHRRVLNNEQREKEGTEGEQHHVSLTSSSFTLLPIEMPGQLSLEESHRAEPGFSKITQAHELGMWTHPVKMIHEVSNDGGISCDCLTEAERKDGRDACVAWVDEITKVNPWQNPQTDQISLFVSFEKNPLVAHCINKALNETSALRLCTPDALCQSHHSVPHLGL